MIIAITSVIDGGSSNAVNAIGAVYVRKVQNENETVICITTQDYKYS